MIRNKKAIHNINKIEFQQGNEPVMGRKFHSVLHRNCNVLHIHSGL